MKSSVAVIPADLIVADGRCPRIAELLPAALHEVVALGSGSGPLAAITAELQSRRRLGQPLDTLHIVAHGRPGAFQIGGQWVDAAALIAHADLLAGWQLQRIALWSCQVGADRGFIALLEELTGATVYSSDRALGLDPQTGRRHWDLQAGEAAALKSPEAFASEALGAWQSQLVSVTVAGVFKAVYSYDPSGWFGEETSKIDIQLDSLETSNATFSQSGAKFSGNNVLGTLTFGSTTITGALASRPIKQNGVVKGFYIWIDKPATGASASDEAWVISFDNAYFQGLTPNPSGVPGSIANQVPVGSSSDRVDKALNAILGQQQSGIQVDNAEATEGIANGDPNLTYLVFKVTNTNNTSKPADDVRSLNSVSVVYTDLTASAADFTTPPGVTIEYSTDQTSWSTNKPASLNGGAVLYIRVGQVFDDNLVEGDEVFELRLNVNTASKGNTTADVSGFGTIKDNESDAVAPLISPQAFEYPENRQPGEVVATVVATDNIAVTQFRFTDTQTNLSADGFYQIDEFGNITITAAGAAAGVANNDYETTPNSFTYDIEAGDAAGNWSTKATITLKVTDLNDTLAVDNIDVNEGSPFAVFKVFGPPGQDFWLGLTPGTATPTGTPEDPADYVDSLEYFDEKDQTWKLYTTGPVQLPADGTPLLVRVQILQDDVYEGPQSFKLVVAPKSDLTGGVEGTATIYDDGTGNIYPDNNTGNPDPNALKDDDRTVQVNDIDVNEGSPYAVFTIKGPQDLELNLSLSGGTATLGTDTDSPGNLEYFNGSNWVKVNGTPVVIGSTGILLVRIGITNDNIYEGPETFRLNVNPTNGGTTVYGTATIWDDGTGDIFPDNNTGDTDPQAIKDDDRLIKVNNISVNEASPYAVFTVKGVAAGQPVTLALQNDNDPDTADAEIGIDTGTKLQYFDGTSWKDYTGPFTPTVAGDILVRVAIVDDDVYEGPETFQLAVTQLGKTYLGTATIYDDGTGEIYPDNNTGNPDPEASKDDDRVIKVNNIEVNEASPYAVFTVEGIPQGTTVTLALQNDNDPDTANAEIGIDTGIKIEYFDGEGWVEYTGPIDQTQTPLPSGPLLVRVAIINDNIFEGPETFQLAVTAEQQDKSPLQAYGTATIFDDGTGNIYPDNTTGNPDPDAVKDDDRVVKVNDILVNEASPFAVFKVTGVPGQEVSLSLQNDNDPNTADATLGVDTGTQLQYFNGTTWVDYTTPIKLPNGPLLVRVAIINDDIYEGPETFQLKVLPKGGVASYGTATIVDDGTGNIYPNNPTGNPDPNAVKDDDRAVKVNDISVNEASPYAVFTVKATKGQSLILGLQNDTDPSTADATLGVDTGTKLQYFDGTDWLDYDGISVVAPGDTFLVRVAINNDDIYEGPETFLLSVQPVGGTTSYGTATIFDDGSGEIYPDNTTGTPDPTADKDDDRPVRVNDIEVNEGSPYAVFTIEVDGTQNLKLALQNDNDPNTADATLGVDTGTELEYLLNGTWEKYVPGSTITVPGPGTLKVRVAIKNDDIYEGPETFQLAVTPVGGLTSYGTATIFDDGTGNVYPDNNSGDPDPNAPKDDDRNPIFKITGTNVNEASPYVLWTLEGPVGEIAKLAFKSGTTNGATPGTDTGNTLQVLVGGQWTNYDPNNPPAIDGTGKLLVRVNVIQDTDPEGTESLDLVATNKNDQDFTGTSTINDEGIGSIFLGNNITDTPDQPGATDPDGPDYPAFLDDDRPLKIDGTNVNESSPYVLWTITGVAGQKLFAINLQPGDTNTATIGTDTLTNSDLQVLVGGVWVAYNPALALTIDNSGKLLVRVKVIQDDIPEGTESLKLAVNNVGGKTFTGTSTINDEGEGVIFLPENITPTPNKPGDSGYPAKLDDDRTIAVKGTDVNEASPYVLWTVSGGAGQLVSLLLQPGDTTPATIGNDTGPSTNLEVLVDGKWEQYNPQNLPKIGATGQLLVRINVVQDDLLEGTEFLKLTATSSNTGRSATAVSSINDEGKGSIFLGNNTTDTPNKPGDLDPNGPDYPPLLDDDRRLKITGTDVNESSPYVVWTVEGAPGQLLGLTLQPGDTNPATPGTDTGTTLQVLVNGVWKDYDPTNPPSIDPSGKLLVRVNVIQDDIPEGTETLKLVAVNGGGQSFSGTSTISDEGQGQIFLPENITPTPNKPGDPGYPDKLDDDRGLTIAGTNVNEASPFVLWTVSGNPGAVIGLTLQPGDITPATPGNDTGTTLQVLVNGTWKDYDPTNPPSIDSSGKLLVRVNVIQDDVPEGTEYLKLVAVNSAGKSFSGTSTINDEGKGEIFLPGNTTSTPNKPSDPGYPSKLDDDRPLTIAGTNVNEASPFVVWTVTGGPGQLIGLSLQPGDTNPATPGTDTGTTLQVLVNGAWVDYDPTKPPSTDPSGKLLVRVSVKQDDILEGTETLKLVAVNTGGQSFTGTSTINDVAQGDIFLPGNITATPNKPGDPGYPAQLDDDRSATRLVPTDDGKGLKVVGDPGKALWVDLSAVLADASLQNGFDLIRVDGSGQRFSIGAIGATPDSGFFGDNRFRFVVGEELRFTQVSGELPANPAPDLEIQGSDNCLIVGLDDDGGDGDADDLVLKVKTSTADPYPVASKIARYQTSSELAYLDLSWIGAAGITLNVDVQTDCGQKNNLRLVKVDTDANGKPLGTVGGIAPSAGSKFDQAVLSNLLSYSYDQLGTETETAPPLFVPGAQAGVYAPVLITEAGAIYTFGGKSSSDSRQHVKVLGANSFAFEDAPAKSADWDYNDAVISFRVADPTSPSLVLTADGKGLTVVGGTGEAAGLWLDLNAVMAKASYQNSFDLYREASNGAQTQIGSIGATSEGTFLGSKELFIGVGETLRFVQNSNDDLVDTTPALEITQIGDRFRVALNDDGIDGIDEDYDDLVVDVDRSPLEPCEDVVKLASRQLTSSDGILDLTGLGQDGARLKLSFLTDSGDANTLSFVKLEVDKLTGEYTVAGKRASDGQAFRDAVLANTVDFEATVGGVGTTDTRTWQVNQNQSGLYAAVLITPNDTVFTFGDTTASDGRQHLKVLGDSRFGFEDALLSQGSDFDYNDMTVKIEII